jgi:hypothetical protein
MIRRANSDDLDALMPMAERFYTSCPWAKIADYDPETARVGMASLLANENCGLFVIDRDGHLFGAFGCVLTPVWLSTDFVVAQEVFWWVEPEARGTRESLELWIAADRWAEKSGAKAAVMIRLEGMGDEALHRTYLSRGYTPVEHHYVRKLG